MPPPEFRYMAWAKAHATAGRFHLGRSGVGPPPVELLAEPDGAMAIAAPGADMPQAARERLAARFEVAPERLMLTLGTSHALYLACLVLLEPGDSVWVEQPTYEVLARLPQLQGARVERFERSPSDGFGLGHLPERVRAERPRLVLLSNPHNPSGALLDHGALAPLVHALGEVGGTLLVDEVYLEFSPDAPRLSAALLGEHVAVAASLTKAYGLGAVRFGWLRGSAELIEAATRANDYVSVLYPSPSAELGMRALARLDGLHQRLSEIRESNEPLLASWLAAHPDLGCLDLGMVTMVWIHLEAVRDTARWCAELLQHHETLVVPGEFFEAPGWIRLGFGGPTADLRQGLDRIAEALARTAAVTP